MSRALTLLGQRWGRLLVLERASNTRSGHASWVCECDCGAQTTATGANLRSGNTTSCGCAKGSRPIRHGASRRGERASEFSIWCNMRSRCRNPNNPNYPRYGGRGITVCDRWNSYENFAADMGPRPSGDHSVERVDNDKGYSPDNCVWATRTTQARNRRPRKLFTHCRKGHELTEDNLYVRKNGARTCLVCKKMQRANPKRVRLTKAERAAMLIRQDGRCIVRDCGATHGLIEEHSTPHVWTGAKADQLMCVPCHKEKTRRDIKNIAKARRIANHKTQADKRKARGYSLIKGRAKIENRGFDKTKTRHFDGKVSPRNGR